MIQSKELTEDQKSVASYLESKLSQYAQGYQQAKEELQNYVSTCASSLGIDFRTETWNYTNGHFEKVETDAKSNSAEGT